MKIAYLLGSLRFGGAERHLTHLLGGLDRERYDPRLYLTRRTGDFLPAVEALGVPIEETGVPSVFTPAGLRGIVDLAREFERVGIDIVHSYLYGANLIGMGVNALSPALVHLIGIRQQVLPHPKVFRALFGVAAGPRTQFVSVSKAADAVLGDWGVDPRWRHRVPNGVEIPRETWSPRECAAKRDELGVPHHGLLITMVANFHPVKGHADLIRAFALLPKLETGGHRIPELALIGAGTTEESCRDLASTLGVAGRVHFVGHRADVPAILQASDIFVLNSKSEGMSNALLEAMVAGLPCIATAVGGNSELVREDDNGYLVPVGQPEVLARLLARLVGDMLLRERMGRRSEDLVRTEYGVEAMVRRTEAIYDLVQAGLGADATG